MTTGSSIDSKGLDDQRLFLNGQILSIEDGNDVDLSTLPGSGAPSSVTSLQLVNGLFTIQVDNTASQTIDLAGGIPPLTNTFNTVQLGYLLN